MKVRVFYPDKTGKIAFTREQLEKLLDEVYEEGRLKGYYQGYNADHPYTITYPYQPYWYTTTSTDDHTTITCAIGKTIQDNDCVTINTAQATNNPSITLMNQEEDSSWLMRYNGKTFRSTDENIKNYN